MTMKNLLKLLTLKNILIIFSFLFIDLLLAFLFGGYLEMEYEYYTVNKEEFYNFSTMKIEVKIAYIALKILGFLNWFGIVYLIYKIITYFVKRKNTNLQYLDFPKDNNY